MENIENNGIVSLSNNVENQSPGNYTPVRYNALKHGILAQLAVLPHEDKAQFDELLEALIIEHNPAGPTEMHLVEELASIIWRKRRVLLAEGATINRGLHNVATGFDSKTTKAAAPFVFGMPDNPSDIHDLMSATPEDVVQMQNETRLDREHTDKAAALLRKGGPSAYEKALKALLPDSREWWQEYVEEEEYQPTPDGLAGFIHDHLRPICIRMEKEALHLNAIKAQTLGEGLKAERLEKLSRYETHLDRKFERILAMLLKLKDMRDRE
jgi:hypothetical protein